MKNSRVMVFECVHGSSRYMRTFSFALCLVILLPVLSGCCCLMESRTNAWENRCKLTLRALGSTQLAFSDGNEHEYGTFAELLDQDYIQKGYDESNIIDNYNIVVFSVQKSSKDEEGIIITPADFLIVAVPDDIYYRLRTFAIGSEQTPKAWIGKSEEFDNAKIDLNNSSHWEPIR